MRSSWTVLLVTLAIQAMVSMALLTLPVMAPSVARDLGISPVYIGLYIAVVYSGALFASLASGAAVRRWGAIRVSQAGLLLCAAGLGLCMVPVLPVIAIGALLVGLGYGPVTPASSHLLAKTTPAHRMSLVFSVKQTGVPLGGALAGAIIPSLQELAGWQVALLLAALANLVFVAVAQLLRAELDADRDAAQPLRLQGFAHPLRLVFGHRGLRMLATCSFVFSIAQLSLTTYSVTYLTGSLGYGLVAAGLMLSISQFAGVGGRIFWGYVSDRWLGARRMLALLAALMAASAMAAAMLQPGVPLPLVLVVLALFGASAIGWNGVYLAEVARQAPAGLAGVATGGTLAFTFLGVVLGPPVFGGIAGATGSFRASFIALAVLTLGCAVALARARLDPPAA